MLSYKNYSGLEKPKTHRPSCTRTEKMQETNSKAATNRFFFFQKCSFRTFINIEFRIRSQQESLV